MSLRHIILGLLDEPASGYDLRREFGASLKHFWAAELSRIYPALSALERDGFVVSRKVPSPMGPDRREYRRTDVGEEELEAWRRGEALVGTERLTWLAQVFFLGELHDSAAAAGFLRRLRDAMTARLEALRAVEANWRSEDPDYPDLPPERGLFKQMTLSLGLLRIAAMIEWCDQSLKRLARGLTPRRAAPAVPPNRPNSCCACREALDCASTLRRRTGEHRDFVEQPPFGTAGCRPVAAHRRRRRAVRRRDPRRPASSQRSPAQSRRTRGRLRAARDGPGERQGRH